ncbi:MAG: glycosyltransferase family 4 protein [Chitinispirillaceae bacterium]|nr:glycosyltransferase family 4 protein [Chitinispirillaceae bacterium]
MRIAFDAYTLGAGSGSGNATYSVELIKALAGLSKIDRIMLVTYWNRKQKVEKVFQQLPHCSILNMFPHPKILGDRLRFLATATHPLFERILKSRCDLFHCTNPTSFPFHLPVVATTILDLIGLRDEPWAQPNSKLFFQRHAPEIMHRSSHVFAISEYTRSDIIQRFPFAEKKTSVTPLAANPAFRVVKTGRAFLSRYGLTDTLAPYLLHVGDIQPRKNIFGLVKTFESLPDRFRDFRLVIIGQARNRQMSGPILAAIAASLSRNRIFPLHSVADDDLVLFYNHAEGLLFFSFFEGFGLPVLEAMQCGCPVVASDTSSIREIAENAALMVDPYDNESMREGIIQLIDNRSTRETLRRKGLERAGSYSWRTTAELTLEGYNKIVP